MVSELGEDLRMNRNMRPNSPVTLEDEKLDELLSSKEKKIGLSALNVHLNLYVWLPTP